MDFQLLRYVLQYYLNRFYSSIIPGFCAQIYMSSLIINVVNIDIRLTKDVDENQPRTLLGTINVCFG